MPTWPLLCLINLLLTAAGLLGQPVAPMLNFAPELYGAARQNWSIQAGDLRVYTGNADGLVTYDGEHWHLYRLPGNHQVRAIKVLGDTVFGGGYGEFGYWLPDARGGLQYHSLSQDLDFPLAKEEEIWHIERFSGGVLFQSFSTVYLLQGGQISIFQSPFPSGIMFCYRVHGKLMVQVLSEGLAELDPQSGFRLIPETEALINTTVTGIVPWEGDWLISTNRHGLFRFDGNRLRPAFTELQPLWERDQINKMIATDQGLVLGTILNGLYVLDQSGAVVSHLHRRTGLQDNTVLAMHMDDRGRLWLGLDQGISMVDLSATVREYQDLSGEIGVIYAAKVFQDYLYLGSNHGLFQVPWPWESFSTSPTLVPGTQGQVWTLEEIQGALYCGHNDGTFRIGPNASELVTDITGGWSWLPWAEGSQQTLWLQGSYTGLLRYQWQGGQLSISRIAGLGMPLRDLVRDRQGYIWAAHPYRGLYRIQLDAAATEVTAIETSATRWQLPDLNRLRIFALQGEVLVRSDSGWFQWQQAEQAFRPIHDYRGIPLSLDTEQLGAWGHRLFSLAGEEITVMADADTWTWYCGPMPDDVAVQPLGAQTLLLGQPQGFSLIRPGQEFSPTLADLQVTRLQASGPGGSLSLPLPRRGSTVQLDQRAQELQVAFSSGLQGQPLHYRYRVSGLQPAWSAWSESATIRLPVPGGGTYQIEIERLEDGHRFILPFQKAHPWYVQDWAILMFVLAIVAMMYLGLQRYQNWLEKRWRRQQVEAARARHAREMSLRNQQLEENLEKQNQELAGVTMNLVRKNEILLELRAELQALQKVKPSEAHPQLRRITLTLNSQLSSEKDWEAFEYHFTRVHQGFFQGLKADYPNLTPGDLRLAAYLRMNLSSKEIAPLLHISVRSVENKRYRFRQKLGLSGEQQLIDILLKY